MTRGAYERAKGILVHLLSSTARGAREEGNVLSDIIDDIMGSNQKYSVTAQSMNDYFMPFMLKASGHYRLLVNDSNNKKRGVERLAKKVSLSLDQTNLKHGVSLRS